jgi:hypothetical protein
MLCQTRTVAVVGALLVASLSVAGRADAAEYTYAFTGQVTGVDNPFGLFTTPASVGAPVTGSFTYTDTPSNAPFVLNPSFTNYNTGGGGEPQVTGLVLTVGSAEVRSAPSSLTNMIVGNDNTANVFAPFFPAGDSFRYSDSLDTTSALFDFSASDLAQFPTGAVFLTDPTATAFNSQALPAGGLPLSGLTDRSGLIYLEDDNFEQTGRLTFRIDSIRAVPEPGSLVLFAAAAFALTRQRRQG